MHDVQKLTGDCSIAAKTYIDSKPTPGVGVSVRVVAYGHCSHYDRLNDAGVNFQLPNRRFLAGWQGHATASSVD